jgi:hypothetical protein
MAKLDQTMIGIERALSYHVRPRAGQTVELVERGQDVFHVLGPARGTSGEFRFTPAFGPAGRRQIVALVSLSGRLSQTLLIGSYTAPPTPTGQTC